MANPYTFSSPLFSSDVDPVSKVLEMRQHHDLGGLAEGPVDISAHEPSLFDKRVDALMLLLVAPPNRFFSVDAQRRTQESMAPERYKTLRYYERWIDAIASLLIEADKVSQIEIDSRIASVAERLANAYRSADGFNVPEHDHDHAPIQDDHRLPREHEILEEAVRELCIERGYVTASKIQNQIDAMESRTPSLGANLIARAWTDTAFHRDVMDDAKAAAEAIGIDMSGSPAMQAVQNTHDVHHMVVCTLCSCYPRLLLGVPPAWYKSRSYRARAVVDPRGVLAEFGTILPETMDIRVVDSTADLRYVVIPTRPEGTENWSATDLAGLVTRDSMIGVTPALAPSTATASTS